MKYFNENMSASEVRRRLYDLLYLHKVDDAEIPKVKAEHKIMCGITVDREMKLADAGWMTEEA